MATQNIHTVNPALAVAYGVGLIATSSACTRAASAKSISLDSEPKFPLQMAVCLGERGVIV